MTENTIDNNDKKPIIMQVLPQLQSGGVERVTIDTAGFLARVDDRPTYVVSAGGALVSELEKRGVNHINLHMGSKNPLTIILNGIRLARLGKQLGIDLFHARSRAPAWSVWLASKISGIPFITTYHGAYRNKGRLSNWYNSAMVRGKCVITISDFVGSVAQKDHAALKPTLIKIYPGIDTDTFRPDHFSQEDIDQQKQAWNIPLDAPVLLVIGRIAPNKRFDLGIEALAKLPQKNIHLVMAGSDQGKTALSDSLLDLAKKRGVEDRVHLIKDFKNLPLAYALSDLVLFPTQHIETYGRITAEAGAMGKIVIATTIGAVPELIIEGETGFLIPPGDLDSLVSRIKMILSLSPEEKERLERQALHHIQQYFSAHRMYAQTLDLYKKVVAGDFMSERQV